MMLKLGNFFYHTVFSEDILLLNCKIIPNVRATSPDSFTTPNVDIQRQMVILVHLNFIYF